ncbi:MAG: hypothetical protein AB7T31_02235 [Gemmatimonadales bacterium]
MRARALVLLLLVGAMVAPRSAAAYMASQTPGPVRLVAFMNEPMEPEFGKVFELFLQLRLAPDVVTFVPDTLLPAPNAVSAGPAHWTTEPGPADSIDVRATYYVMGLANGGVELPTLELWTRPPAPGEAGGPRPASELGDSLARRDELRRIVLEIGGAMIQVPSEMQGEDAAIDPHPPADVLGGEWSPWRIGAVAVGVLAVLALGWIFLSGRWSAAAHVPVLGASPRAEALRELDRLLALGWHTDGRVYEFYDATTNVLRQLSEHEQPDWSRALTSSELVARIEGRWGRDAVTSLRPAVWSAEWVKFGTDRPTAAAAERDWTVIRDWIRGLPES